MQTYTHYVMTVLINQRLNVRVQRSVLEDQTNDIAPDPLPPLRSGWLLFGSVLPDIPLILLFFGTLTADLLQGNVLDPGNENAASQSYTGYLFDYAFFHDPWVKLTHNLFHAPLLILFYIIVGYWIWKRGKAWGAALFWLGAACALHTAIDIPVHYNDGPLIFFPFDWNTRFYSPISYWEQGRGGVWFTIFEHLLLLCMLIYLSIGWWQKRRARQQITNAAPTGE